MNYINVVSTWACYFETQSGENCLKSKDLFVGKERIRATFTPGYNTAQRNPNPQGTANVRDFHIYPAFHACDGGDYSDCHMNNDFAVLVLDRPYQNWMRYGHQETITAATMINTAGYPGADGGSALCALGFRILRSSEHHRDPMQFSVLSTPCCVELL